jgi:hypothetical protein
MRHLYFIEFKDSLQTEWEPSFYTTEKPPMRFIPTYTSLKKAREALVALIENDTIGAPFMVRFSSRYRVRKVSFGDSTSRGSLVVDKYSKRRTK